MTLETHTGDVRLFRHLRVRLATHVGPVTAAHLNTQQQLTLELLQQFFGRVYVVVAVLQQHGFLLGGDDLVVGDWHVLQLRHVHASAVGFQTYEGRGHLNQVDAVKNDFTQAVLAHRVPRRQAVGDDVIGDTLDLNLSPAEAERRHNRVVKRLAVKADERRVWLLHKTGEASRGVV